MMKALPIPKIKMNQVLAWFRENLLLVLTFLGRSPYYHHCNHMASIV